MRRSKAPRSGLASETSLMTSCSLSLSPRRVWQLVIDVHRTWGRCQSLCWPGSLNDCMEQGLPYLFPHHSGQIHHHCLPTGLCVNKIRLISWSYETWNFSYFSLGYISWKGNGSLSLGTPHIHGPLQRTKKGPWQWFHVVIFVFFLKFAEVKCFSYKW